MARFFQVFKTKQFGILLTVLAALLLLTIYTARSGSVVLSNVLGLSMPLQKGAAQSAGRSDIPYDDLLAENKALQQQVASLTKQLSGYYEYQQENRQLRSFLGLKTENPDISLVYGDVIARDGTDFFYGFRVDKGTRDGVAVHDPVLTEAGLVGHVSSVTGLSCTVTTLLSPGSNAAAMDRVSRDGGVVTGDVALAEQGLVRLSYLERENNVRPGDMIVTSGIGGFYPKGLLIGKAVEVRTDESDVSLYATVELYADIRSVQNVVIITDFAGREAAAS